MINRLSSKFYFSVSSLIYLTASFLQVNKIFLFVRSFAFLLRIGYNYLGNLETLALLKLC